jgi:error-prone DNA polymerase
MTRFVQLEHHSVYSLCEGTIFISELVSRARSRQARYLSLCDTNGFYGLVNFLTACSKAGLRPIIGTRVKHRSFGGLLIARSMAGYGAICELLSAMHLDTGGALDLREELLERRAEELRAGAFVVITRDRELLRGLLERAREGVFAEINVLEKDYGADYAHARRIGARPVLISPVYFLRPEDHSLHRLLRAIHHNKKLSSLLPGDAESERSYALDDDEILARYSFMEDALGNTAAVAEECSFEPVFGAPILPRSLPQGEARGTLRGGNEGGMRAGPGSAAARETESEDQSFARLRALCEENLPKRYGEAVPELLTEVRARLERELNLIRSKGLCGYFLVVHDFVKRSVYTCGRGSAAASLVAYLLFISHVDPIKHNLFFERFLNEARSDPPDIDVDFPWDTRDEILDYIFETYGEDRSAMVSNHITFSVRSSVREVAKVHGMPEGEIGSITRHIGYYYHRESDDFFHYSAGREKAPSPFMRRIYRDAVAVNGRPRHLSVHCGGVVITPGPIARYIPVERARKGVNVIQLEKDQAEDFGFVKIDVLGNRSLAVVRDALALVQEHRGVRIRYEEFNPLDDEKTVRMLAEGNTMGVFYVESPAMRQLQKKTGRGDYEHLVIHSSIIRPAANRYIREYVERLRGKPWKPLLPQMEEILKETYGIMCYQEDITKIALEVAGFPLAEACELRKVIGRKNKLERKLELKALFERNLRNRGVGEQVIERIWDMIESFSGYSFCKPHSASYALLSFKSCWLKAHYPAEFMGAVLKNQGGYYCALAYISEARRMGLKVEKPDVNASRYEYYGRGDTVYIGFMQIKNLSSALAKAIAPEREKNGPYRGVADFMGRTGAGLADTVLLIRAECFRVSGPVNGAAPGADAPGEKTRAQAPFTQPQLLYIAHAFDRRREKGGAPAGGVHAAGNPRSPATGSLFTGEEAITPPPMRDISPLQRIGNELELYGFPVSIHPMEHWRKKVRDGRVIPAKELDGHVGKTVRVAGILITAKTVLTRQNDLMQFISFEDETAIFETVFFPKTYSRYSRRLAHQRPYILTGRVDSEFGVVSLNVREIEAVGEEPQTRAFDRAPAAEGHAAGAHLGARAVADSSGGGG